MFLATDRIGFGTVLRLSIARLAIALSASLMTIGSFSGLPGGSKPLAAQEPGLPAASAVSDLARQAEQAYQRSDFPRCVELANTAIAQNPRDHVAFYFRASAKVEMGLASGDTKQVRSGVEDAREALKFGGTVQTNYYLPYLYGMTGLSRIEGRKEHADVSIQIANQVLGRAGLAPDSKANIHYQKALALLALRQPENAATEYAAAIALLPGHLAARLGLAEAYVLAGQPDAAEKAYAETVRVFPSHPMVFNNRGMFYQSQGKYDLAVSDFTTAMSSTPSFPLATTNRGYVLLSAGRPASAEKDFTQAMTLDPNNPLNYSLRGASRLSQGRIADARADFETVLRMDPRNAMAKADLAFASYFAKEYEAASKLFDEAVTMDPNLRYLDPWRYWTLMLRGQGAEALGRFEASWKKGAETRDWTDHLLSFLAGQIDEAALLAAVGRSDAPVRPAQSCEAYYFAAEKKRVGGDPTGAAADYDRALSAGTRMLSAYRGALYATNRAAPEQ